MTEDRTLDPADWSAFRALAHRMVDDMLDHLSSLREQPAWRAMPANVRGALHEPLPTSGIGDAAAYAHFVERVLPYTNGNLHPRFWGWVQGNGTPLGMMADMLAAGINPHLAGFNQAPALVEHQVVAWIAQLVGLPADASGLMVTGGTMANTLGLAVARHAAAARLGFDVRENGVAAAPRPLVFYGSTETHNWARKSAELLGLGNRAFRRVDVDDDHRIRIDLLRDLVARDRAQGLEPFCVIGSAGTVNTGAIDDLASLARLCDEESLWFHVDGAFGALAYVSPELRPLLDGIEHADSVGVDLHKWGYLPFDCACALVRDPALHRAAFATTASYLAETTRGVIAGGLPFAERGLDLTRSFKALKVWLSLKAYGSAALAALIEQNVAHAQYLVDLVEQNDALELLAPRQLNIVCFRYTGGSARDERLNDVNQEILLRLQESGIAVPSGTTLNGRFALRVANVNHRSRREDFDALVEAVVRIGGEVSSALA